MCDTTSDLTRTAARFIAHAFAAAVAAIAMPTAASADIIYSSLAPQYFGGLVLTNDGDGGTHDFAIASSFTVGPNDYTFDRLGLVLYDNPASDDTAQLVVQLRSDDQGTPGAILETFSVTEDDLTSGFTLVMRDSMLHSPLLANGTYWIAALPGQGFHGSWATTATNATLPYGLELNVPFADWFQATGTLGLAMVIEGTAGSTPTPVPEPSTLALLGGGLIAVVRARRGERAARSLPGSGSGDRLRPARASAARPVRVTDNHRIEREIHEGDPRKHPGHHR